MIVDIAYPAPIIHVPKGRRTEQLGFAAMRTSARLRTASRADFQLVHAPERQGMAHRSLYAFDGCLWRQAGDPGSYDASDRALVAYLADSGPGFGYSIHRDHFTRTPLVGCALQGIPSRGDVTPGMTRRIELDGRPAAEARLLDFLASDIVLADGEAFLRCWPVLTTGMGRKGAGTSQSPRLEPGHWRAQQLPEWPSPESGSAYQEYAFRVDRGGDLRDFVLGSAPQLRTSFLAQHVFAPIVPSVLLGDEDLACMANVLPEYVLRTMSGLRKDVALMHSPDGEDVARFDRAMAGLRTMAMDGSVGGVAAADYEGAIEASAAAVALTRSLVPYPEVGLRLGHVTRYVETVARRRFAEIAGGSPDQDMETLADLAP